MLQRLECARVADGVTLCAYPPAADKALLVTRDLVAQMRAHMLESLTRENEQRAVRRLVLEARRSSPRNVPEALDALRRALRALVRWQPDDLGQDTVQTVAGSLSRGVADCVSLTIAMSACSALLLGDAGIWRFGGDEQDAYRHVWPVILGVHCDPSDPMPPAGEKHGFYRVWSDVPAGIRLAGGVSARAV